MKTLDEVIEAEEICSQIDAECSKCPYKATAKGWCEEKDLDALFYLKEYRDYRNSDKTVTENGCVSEAENNALTWQELKELEGKPVWVETKRYGSRWYLVEDNTYDDMIVFTGLFGEIAPYF